MVKKPIKPNKRPKRPGSKSTATSHPDVPPRASAESAPQPSEAVDGAANETTLSFPIVAVGASAGGLEAFSQLLEQMPPQSGMAIIFIQHLAPKNASLLPELLATHTRIPVDQVIDGVTVVPNRVYVIPPDKSMSLADGALRLTKRLSDHTQHTPIDTFFTSLADSAQSRAIGVILSGTASDGVIGIKAIKAAGGITFAQEPESAKFDGMPRAAIATEAIDLVLPPAGIAAELARIAQHPYLRISRPRASGDELTVGDEQMRRIFQLLRAANGVDFSHYKLPTIRRRRDRYDGRRRSHGKRSTGTRLSMASAAL